MGASFLDSLLVIWKVYFSAYNNLVPFGEVKAKQNHFLNSTVELLIFIIHTPVMEDNGDSLRFKISTGIVHSTVKVERAFTFMTIQVV